MKAIKITNPLWLRYIAPRVEKFIKLVNAEGISYEYLITYFQQTAQYGGSRAEFWVAINDNKPLAFAHWYVCGLPNIGKVNCDYIYSWVKDRRPAEILVKEFIEFGKRNNCPLYEGYSVRESVFRAERKILSKIGYDIKRMETIHFIGRKRHEGVPESNNRHQDGKDPV